MIQIFCKRIYDKASADDGFRILIDRLWPRGISKEEACIDEWLKDIAPSNELRTWFHHQPELFPEFKSKYIEELKSKNQLITHILHIAKTQKVCLLYGAKDKENNQAVVLLGVLLNN
jgi:uncharacterized protein YeaO (DUF488 family)